MELKHPLDNAALRTAISAALGISQQAITNWIARGRVPVEHCTVIEKATCGAVTRQELRPNDWQLIWPELKNPQQAEEQGA